MNVNFSRCLKENEGLQQHAYQTCCLTPLKSVTVLSGCRSSCFQTEVNVLSAYYLYIIS